MEKELFSPPGQDICSEGHRHVPERCRLGKMDGQVSRDTYDVVVARLLARWGELVPPNAIWKELGYKTAAGVRSARHRGVLPVETFKIAGRRGYYARSRDIALWLARAGATGQEVCMPNDDA